LSERARKDVDEVILDTLRHRGSLSPNVLQKACTSQGISRATYFRHKGKLKRLRQIEEIKQIDAEGKTVKKFRYVGPNELADQGNIEFYLGKIEDPNKEIRDRNLNFFHNLSQSLRLAWYFSPKFSPKFKSKQGVRKFFRDKLLKSPEDVRLQFLKILEEIIRIEPPYSLWRIDLVKSCQKILEEIAWKEENIEVRMQAITVLILIGDVSLVCLGLSILEEPIGDHDFNSLLGNLKQILIKSREAKTKKLVIRDKLDEFSIKTDTLKTRVRKVLEGAPP